MSSFLVIDFDKLSVTIYLTDLLFSHNNFQVVSNLTDCRAYVYKKKQDLPSFITRSNFYCCFLII